MGEAIMRRKHFWSANVLVFCLVLAVPIIAGAQQNNTQVPVLLSTGLPATETPEEILPNGAIVYLRANNLQVLVENIDKLLTTFVPEKALPPDLQPIFANPQPFIALFGMQAFGQPVEVSGLSNLIGIALDRPVSLAFYPMDPKKGFVLSVPISNPALVTGMVQGILAPETIEQGTIGNIGYYRVVPSDPDLPRELYIMTSEKAAFFCGSFNVAQMLVNSGNMGTLNTDPMITKGVGKYANHDLTLIVSPGLLKSQLPLIQQGAARALIPVFQQVREGVKQIPPAERLMIDSRLRLQFGIDGVDQLVDYAEAYSSGIYKVLLEKVVQVLTDLEGIALSVDFGEKFQKVSLMLFSQDIRSEDFTRSLPLDDIKQALNALPGDKGNVIAVGRAPETHASKLFTNILNAVEEELTNKGLPADGFSAYKEYYLAKQYQSPLESKVEWTLKTLLAPSEKTDFNQFNTLGELLKYALDRLSSGAFLVSMTLMPSVEEGLIETHFSDEARMITQNEQNYRKMREKLPFKQPFFDLTSKFQQKDLGENLTKLILEKIYTTRRGFFGYQQHELINRRIMFHQKKAGYEIMYDGGADEAFMKTLLDQTSHAVPEATIKLIEQTPSGANTLSLLRTLYLVSGVLDVLSGVEDVIHREMDAFLVKAQELVDAQGTEEFDAKLLEARLEIPLLMASLYLDENGKVYCMLPGGLHYPRPTVMPKVKELFKDFLAAASDVGGSASFITVQQGEFELSSVQSTEAMALLVKTVVNNFYEQYMSSPDGLERLQNILKHPADFQKVTAEPLFVNPFWKTIMGKTELPFSGELERSKQTRTVADMRAIGTALGSYQVDFDFFPKYDGTINLQDAGLPQEYYVGAYTDAWGTPFMYISDSDGSQYLLISYGRDQVAGATGESEFDADIVYLNGQFVAPGELVKDDIGATLTSALIQAVDANAIDFVSTLADLGADVNATDATTDEPVLLKAAQNGYTEIVRALVENGADVEAKDSYDLTALFLAAYEGYTDIVQLLLDYGADISVRNAYGMSALLWTAWNGHTETLQVLLDRGADVEEQDNSEETALIKAAYQGHTEIVRILLDRNVDVNVKNSDGADALIYAAWQGYTEIVQLLLDKGADVTAEDNVGQTAMLLAAAHGYTDIVELLKQAGADEVSEEQVETYRQTTTAETMRAIGDALASVYQENSNAYPKTSVDDTDLKEIELLGQYYDGSYEDAWGNAIRYTSDGTTYMLKSYGRDKAAGNQSKNTFDDDIVFSDGKVIAPEYLVEEE
jgi:ankyrin repeat protein